MREKSCAVCLGLFATLSHLARLLTSFRAETKATSKKHHIASRFEPFARRIMHLATISSSACFLRSAARAAPALSAACHRSFNFPPGRHSYLLVAIKFSRLQCQRFLPPRPQFSCAVLSGGSPWYQSRQGTICRDRSRRMPSLRSGGEVGQLCYGSRKIHYFAHRPRRSQKTYQVLEELSQTVEVIRDSILKNEAKRADVKR